MTHTHMLINEVYAAFNRRYVEGALVRMAEDVSWPKASEGGRVVGKEAIRDYWSRQWQEFDPSVTPVEIIDHGNGRVDVRVDQVVKSLGGDVLSDSEVWHVYTFVDDLIARMDLGDSEGSSQESPSSAFSQHAAEKR